MPRGAFVVAAEAAVVASAFPNVWIDLSDCRLAPMRCMIRESPRDRPMLASDDPFGPLERQLDQAREIARADKALLGGILGENARRLLKIDA